MKYDPVVIEEKWQKKWEEEKTFQVTEDPNRQKYYLLEMFLTRPAKFISATSAIIPSVMSSPAISV